MTGAFSLKRRLVATPGCLRGAPQGFTLVELLIVAALLGMIATSALLVVDSGQDQRRYEETRESYAAIRAALFGPDGHTLNGAPLISGYLSDVGALPATLEDLRTKPGAVEFYALIGPAVKGIRLSHGWRGPYLNLQSPDLRDPWGTGWHYKTPLTSISTRLEVGSLGRDGIPGGSGAAGTAAEFDADFPSDVTLAESFYTVTEVPIPRLVLQQAAATPRTVNFGVIKAGLNLTEPFSAHPSLLSRSDGVVVSLDIPAAPATVEVPAGLTVDIGCARQFQIAVYEPGAPGTTLADKLVAAHPQIFTVLPRVSFVEPPVSSSPWTVP